MRWHRRATVAAAVVTVAAGAVAAGAAGLADGDVAGPPPPSSSPSSAYSSHVVVVIDPLHDEAQARELWRRACLTDYRFVWRTSAMVGTSRTVVEVRGGRTTVSPPRPDGGEGPPGSVDEAFVRVEAAERAAASVIVDYDPVLGYPRSVDVDEIANAVDDERSFGIESLRPL